MKTKHPYSLDREGDGSWVVRCAWREVFRSPSHAIARAVATTMVGLYIFKKKLTMKHDEVSSNAEGP
jgi:hypothetical protein